MENPTVILVSSSEDDEQRTNEKKQKKRFEVCESHQNHGEIPGQIIFINLKALRAVFEAEASRTKRNFDSEASEDLVNVENVKGKQKEQEPGAVVGKKKPTVEAIVISDDDDAPENTNEEGQQHTFEANKTTKTSMFGSGIALSSVSDLFFSSPDKEVAIEDANAGAGVASSAVNDLFLTSSREDTLISNVNLDSSIASSVAVDMVFPSSEENKGIVDTKCCRGIAEMVPTYPIPRVNRKKKRRRRRKKEQFQAQVTRMQLGGQEYVDRSAETVKSELVEMQESFVMQRLQRKPRYFDPSNYSCEVSRNCRGDHTAFWRKLCSIPGSFGHKWRHYEQKCFYCKGRDHCVEDCREKKKESCPRTDICLRCGNSGHNMFSCSSNYFPDDLKKIQCYVCKSFGHLCCVDDFADLGSEQVSCYSCGLSGHLGADCTKPRKDISSSEFQSCDARMGRLPL